MKNKKVLLTSLMFILLLQSRLFGQEEFSQPLQDLRRFEIITLGAMPFVTMKTVILTSLCISAGIGITDFVIRIIKRNHKNKRSIDLSDAIKIEVEADQPAESEYFEETE